MRLDIRAFERVPSLPHSYHQFHIPQQLPTKTTKNGSHRNKEHGVGHNVKIDWAAKGAWYFCHHAGPVCLLLCPLRLKQRKRIRCYPAGYLGNAADPVPLVLDLRITHDRVGSSTDPTLNGHLRYPNNLDRSLNEAATDKVRKYRADYNNNPPSVISFIPDIPNTSGRLANRSWNLPLPPHGFFFYAQI